MKNEKRYPKKNIILAVTEIFGISEKEIFTKTRRQEIAEARQVLAYCLRQINKMSFNAIAKFLNGEDHTTAIYSFHRVEKKMESNEYFNRRVRAVIDRILSFDETMPYKNPVVRIENILEKKFVEDKKEKSIFPVKNLVITEREKNIILKYRQGKTLQEIADEFNVTRERIRQIVFKVNLKEAGVKNKDGFEIDFNEYIKGEKIAHTNAKIFPLRSEEKLNIYLEKAKGYTKVNLFCKEVGISENRLEKIFPEILKVIQKNIEEKKNRWSRDYINCRGCGTISVPHLRKGYCEKCAGARSYETRKKMLQQNTACGSCGIDRGSAIRKFGRDLYITKDNKILCKGCFLQATGRKLADSRRKH